MIKLCFLIEIRSLLVENFHWQTATSFLETNVFQFPKFTAEFSLRFTQQVRFANFDENNKELIQHAILLFINSVSSEKLKLLLLKTSARLHDATNEINQTSNK